MSRFARRRGSDQEQVAIRSGILSGGISQAPPHARFPNQVAYAVNATFTVDDGVSKRPGSYFIAHLGSSIGSTANTRLAGLSIGTDSYAVVFGHATLRVFELDSSKLECTVTIDSDAQTYLNQNSAGSSDFLRSKALGSTLYFINATVFAAATEQTKAVTGATVASPSSLTSTGHGLTTGQTVTIDGSTGITPSINGVYAVTVVDADHFTIPVNVTAATGVSATWYRGVPDKTTLPAALTRESPYSTGTLTSNTAANPTVVTESAAHGLVTGQTVVIAGQTGTVSINGTRVVTVLSATTYSVPVNCLAGGGTGGTRTAPAYFRVRLIDWKERRSGNPTTNPAPTILTAGVQIADIAVMRERLVLAGWSYVGLSEINNRTNFYVGDATTIADSDRINAQLPGDLSANIDWLVPVRKAILVFTKEGRQFEMNTSGDSLKPGTLAITPTTRYRAGTRPASAEPQVYFTTQDQSSAHLYEYSYDEISLPSIATDVSQHAKDLIFTKKPDGTPQQQASIRTVAACPDIGSVFVLRTTFNTPSYQGSDVFEYKAQWNPSRERIQSAWTRHSIGDTYLIDDICVIGTNLITLRAYDFAGTTHRILEMYPIAPDSAHRVTA